MAIAKPIRRTAWNVLSSGVLLLVSTASASVIQHSANGIADEVENGLKRAQERRRMKGFG